MSARLLTCIALVAIPAAALAQTGNAYTAPKLDKPGTFPSHIAGAGDVTVQIFVKKDGTFAVSRVLKTTNALDNAAALEVAKTAAYKPAMRDGQPVDAYYDYVIRFSGSGAAAAAPPPAGGGPTAAAFALIREGKYADAKTQLHAYLQTHPTDVQANTLLGVADGFSGDDDGSAAAFDNVPNIPQQYSTLASQSYVKHATNLIDASKFADAVAAAAHVIALSPNSPEGYYLRGVAYANEQNFQAAQPDLQKALDLAKSSKADDRSVGAIEFNLAVSQFNTGALAAGAATAKDVARLDPLQTPKLNQAAYVAVNNSAIALANAGKTADSVAQFENAAEIFPADAGSFYGQAAYVMLTQKTIDHKKLKAEADKALAIDPTNGRALFVNAFVAAQAGDAKTAVANMNKAKLSPLYSSDPTFAKQVDDNLKKLSAPAS